MRDARDRRGSRHAGLGVLGLVLLVSGGAWIARSRPVEGALRGESPGASARSAEGPFEAWSPPAPGRTRTDRTLPSSAARAPGAGAGARELFSRSANEKETPGTEAQLAGEVHDDTGRPVRAFTVHWTTGHLAELAFAARTLEVEDDAGHFALSVPPGGLWLWIAADGHVTSPADWVRPVPSAQRRWTLVRTARVQGVVVSSSGAGVPEARITVAPAGTTRDTGVDGSLRADAEGRFEIPVPPRGFELAAHAVGHARSLPRVVDASPGAELRITLELRAAGRIEGVVVSDEDEPIAAARVWLDDLHARPSEVAGDGSFSIEDLVPGTHRIGADFTVATGNDVAKRRARSITTEAEVQSGETTRVVLTSRSAQPIEIIGSVHGAGPALGGRVTLHPEFGRYALQDVSLVRGRFCARVDGPGIYLVQVTLPSGVLYQRRIVVPNEPTFEVEISLSEASLAGVVLDAAGQPASGITVQLAGDVRHADLADDSSEGRVMTDAEGRFAFAHVRPGVYALTYPAGTLEENVGRECLRDLDVREGDTRDDLVLRLREAGVVRGVVRGEDGRPALSAQVHVLDEQGLPVPGGTARSGTEGAYLVENIRPGPVHIVAFARGEVAVSRTVQVLAGGVATEDLALAEAGSILVAVFERDPQGSPPERSVGAALRLLDDSGIDFALLSGVTRQRGREDIDLLVVGPVPPGTYLLRALNHGGGHVERQVHIRAGDASETSLVFE